MSKAMVNRSSSTSILLASVWLTACGAGDTVDIGTGCDGGCGGGRRDTGPLGPAPDGGPPSGLAVIDERFIDFGAVAVGAQQTLAVRVHGDHAAPSQIAIRGLRGTPTPDDVRLLSVQLDQPLVIPAGRARTIDLAFRPSREEGYSLTLVVDLCETGCTREIEVRGVGVTTELNCVSELDFGSVALNTCGFADLHCMNPTLEPIEIANVTLSPANGVLTLQSPRVIVPALGTGFMSLQFCPVVIGIAEFDVELSVRRRDGALDRVHVPARGAGIQGGTGCQLTMPTSFAFGPVPPNERAQTSVTVTNTGPGPCVRLDAPPVGAPFRTSELPVQLESGQSMQVDLEFAPTAPGYFEALLGASYAGNFAPERVELWISGYSPGGPSNGYEVSSSSAPLAPAEDLIGLVFTNSDDGYARVDLPFEFRLDGVPTRALYATTNGWVSFQGLDAAPPRNRSSYPALAGPNALIALWWDDLFPGMPGGDGTVGIKESGVPPDRVFHVRYSKVPFFAGNLLQNIDVELRLFENSGVFEVHYGDMGSGDLMPAAHISASAGWEGFGGTTGGALLPCSPSCGADQWPTNTLYRAVPR